MASIEKWANSRSRPIHVCVLMVSKPPGATWAFNWLKHCCYLCAFSRGSDDKWSGLDWRRSDNLLCLVETPSRLLRSRRVATLSWQCIPQSSWNLVSNHLCIQQWMCSCSIRQLEWGISSSLFALLVRPVRTLHWHLQVCGDDWFRLHTRRGHGLHNKFNDSHGGAKARQSAVVPSINCDCDDESVSQPGRQTEV